MIDLKKLRESKGYMLAIVNTKTGEYEPASEDIMPVRHGKWIDTHKKEEWYGELYECSVCGSRLIETDNYCPHCGARMQPERKEE